MGDDWDGGGDGLSGDYSERRLFGMLLGEFLGWTRRSPRWLFRVLWGQERRAADRPITDPPQ